MNPDNSQQASQELEKLERDLQNLTNEAAGVKTDQPNPVSSDFPQKPLTETSKSYKSLLFLSIVLLLISTSALVFYLMKNNSKSSISESTAPTSKPSVFATLIPTIMPTTTSSSTVATEKVGGYIKSISLAEDIYTVSLDSAEMIEDSSDPAGYYIYNPSSAVIKYELGENVMVDKLTISNYYAKYKTDPALKKVLYQFEIADGKITKITEIKLPQ